MLFTSKRASPLFALVSLAIAVGCSSSGSSSPVSPSDLSPLPQSESSAVGSGRTLLGWFNITVDLSSPDPVSVAPFRESSFHANIRTFLEDSPCTNCLEISSFTVTSTGFNIGISITHPFANHSELTGFDVRGTIFAKGSFKFPQLGPVVSSPAAGDSRVVNPDGYTTLFNPTEYTGEGLLSYSRGRLLPKGMGIPSGTLGAFKAFYSEGQSEEEGGRRAFLDGDTVERSYEFAHKNGSKMQLGYAIDSCWEPVDKQPPIKPDDFPPSANCAEPFRIDLMETENDLKVECGSTKIRAIVYDHQGVADLQKCSLEAPGLTKEILVDDTPEVLTPDTAAFDFDVKNELGAADTNGEELLLKIDHGGIDPNFGSVPAWSFFVASVAPPSDKPALDSIDPAFGYQGTKVEATIHGSDFKPGAGVLLYQGINEIAGDNFIVGSPCELHGTFDLVGPIGPYTVYVENPGGMWAELKDGFTILKPVTSCTDAFHTDTLGSGSIEATMAQQYDCAFLVSGNHAGMMLGIGEFMWGNAMVAVNVDTTAPTVPVSMPGALGNIDYKSPWTLDVDESTGYIFVTWIQQKDTIEIYDPISGNLAASIHFPLLSNVLSLDSDGYGGFWASYRNIDSPVPHIVHYHFDPGSGLYTKLSEDSFDIDMAYGSIQDMAVLPGYRLYILCTPVNGTILSYDLSGAVPAQCGIISNVFPSPMYASSNNKYGDIEIDQTDFANAPCRIVVLGNLESGCRVVKLDADLNVLKWVSLATRYQSVGVNPDPDISKHYLTLYPRDKFSSEYRLLNTPPDW